MRSFQIAGLEVAPATRSRGELKVCRLASGYDLSLPLHVLHGASPGPTLLLLAAIHGEEIFAIEVIRRVLDDVELAELRGTVVAIPVCNPLSLEQITRNTPFDMLNLNRVFPGKAEGWLSERLAHSISSVIERASAVVHIDGGSAERVIHYIYVKGADDDWGRQVQELSTVFGLEYMYRGDFFPGSVTAYAAQLGIPCIVPEIGGSLLLESPRFMEGAMTGVFNVMKHLGMLQGEIVLPERQKVITRRTLIRIPQGGIFQPRTGLADLNRPLAEGKVLGVIVDPYRLEPVAEIVTPWDQAVIFQMRALMSAVQPGDYAYIVGDANSAVPA